MILDMKLVKRKKKPQIQGKAELPVDEATPERLPQARLTSVLESCGLCTSIKKNRSQLKIRKIRERKHKVKPYQFVTNQNELKIMTCCFANKFSTSHKQKNWLRCWDPLPANYKSELIFSSRKSRKANRKWNKTRRHTSKVAPRPL